MAQPPRSPADDLRVHIDALTAQERRMRLGQPDSAIEVRRICADLGSLFPGAERRPVNPPLAVTATGCWW